MSKPPAFQFYADDFLAGTILMSAEEVGVYIRLLCLQWTKGAVPKCQEKLAKVTDADPTVVATVLAEKFEEFDEGWRNARLEEVRQTQQTRSKSGSKGGSKTQANRQANTQANRQAKSKPPSPSPSPSPTAAASAAADAAWLAVAAAAGNISDLSFDCITRARDAGCHPGQVLQILEFWESRSSDFGVGALHARIANAIPGQRTDAGWPEPKNAKPKKRKPTAEEWRFRLESKRIRLIKAGHNEARDWSDDEIASVDEAALTNQNSD